MILATANGVVQWARLQIGVKEKPPGSNRTVYGQRYDLNGEPWCGIFVWNAFKHAGTDLRDLGINNPAYCPTFLADARDRCRWIPVPFKMALPGDIVFFQFDSGPVDHVGIVTRASDGKTIGTIEGNTSPNNAGSQSNGGCVASRTRGPGVVATILRPPYARPKPPPAA